MGSPDSMPPGAAPSGTPGTPLPATLSTLTREDLGGIVHRFREAWARGERPSIAAHLPVREEDRHRALVELVRADLELRRRAGEDAALESYLECYPELAADRDAFLKLIEDDYRLRPASDAAATLSDYCRRFSLLRDQVHGRADAERPTPSDAGRGAVTPPRGTPPADDALPAIPGYELLGRLGRGGMGIVYKARQLGPNRVVALKMILPAYLGSERLARFRVEAQALGRLQHPNIVQIYEVGDYEGQPFLSLEFVGGGDLARRIASTPQPPADAAALVETLARALQAAHDSGVVHRDLKPANILLARGERPSSAGGDPSGAPPLALAQLTPKITDFGIAKRLDDGATQTEAGVVIGTPSYMAPEQAAGKSGETGPAVDVYALGAVLYELLTGRPPFKGTTRHDTIQQVLHDEPVAPRRLQPTVPRDLETICLKCLEKDPGRRYPTARALAEDLRRYRAGEPIEARPVSMPERALKWARRRPAAAALVVLLGAAAIGLAVAGAWHSEQLRRAVDAARRDLMRELAARQAEQARADEAEKARRQADSLAEVRRLLLHAQEAAAGQRWDEVVRLASHIITRAGTDPALNEPRLQAEALLARAQQNLAGADAVQRVQRFWPLHREALFRATRFGIPDAPAGRSATEAAARAALAQLGVGLEAADGPVLPTSYNDAQRAQLMPACYELLLVLADAVAAPEPGQSPEQERERIARALRTLDRAATCGPPTHPTRAYHLRRAGLLARRGDAAAAAREREAAPAEPNGALDHFLLGEEEYQRALRSGPQQRRAAMDRAVAAFEATLRTQPGHFWAHYFLAVCHLQRLGPGSRPTPEGLNVARASLTACVAQQPAFPWPYLLRGYAHGELGDLAAAEADFDRAGELQLDESARYARLGSLGVLRIRQGRAAEAVELLEQAIALKPDLHPGYLNLAQALEKLGQPDRALAEIDRALRLRPADPSLHSARARLLEARDPDAALRALAEAIRLHGGRPSPPLARDLVARGRLLARQDKAAEALEAYAAALRADPDLVLVHRLRGEALLQLARTEARDDRRQALYQDAAGEFRSFQARGGPDVRGFYGLAVATAKLGYYDQAIAAYSRALAIRADSPGFTARGWLYLLCDAAELAERDFDEAVRLDPESADAYAGRANARVRRGRHREAAADAETAARLGGDSAETLYKAARAYAQAVGRVRAENAARAAPDRRTEEAYADRALELLGWALERQPPGERRRRFWNANAGRDAALDPIRSRVVAPAWMARYGVH